MDGLQLLTEQDKLVDLLTDLIPDPAKGILLTDGQDRIVQANAKASKILDLTPEQLLGKYFSTLCPNEIAGKLQFPPEKLSVEFEYHNKTIHLSSRKIEAGNGRGNLLIFLEDDSIRKSQEKEIINLQERVEDLRSILQSSYDGIYITDRDGLTLFVNKSHERISGIKADTVVGRYMKDLVQEGIFGVTLTDTVVREKRAITVPQAVNNGKHYIITGTPILSPSGEVRKVITNVRDITELIRLEKELKRTEELKETYKRKLFDETENDIIVNSSSFEKTMILARKAASRNSTVLILGETGVGKEVVAKYIHYSSARHDKDYLKINCGAIPVNLLESELFGYVKGAFTGASQNGKMGIFELANGGTLFLDEIGELPMNLQSSLLRVLQDGEITRVGDTKSRKVDVRIIAATNRNIEDMISKNMFRMDLYYRLNVVSIVVPPLRERIEDIPALAEFFIKKLNEKYETQKVLTSGFIQYLCNRDWPGNVRELQNFIERQYAICDEDVLDESGIFEQSGNGIKTNGMHVILTGIPPMREAVADLEKKLLERALERGKNTYKAAELLGISQSTFSRKYIELCGQKSDQANSG